jgi:Xaa-Pro aminopeptidase
MPGRSGQLRYVANFNSFLGNTVVIIPQSGDPALITETVFHGEPMHAMIFTTWIKDIRWTDHPAATKIEDFIAEVRDVFVEKGLEKARVGIAGDRWIPASLNNALLEAFPGVGFRSALGMYQNVTAIKSPLEIELMREAVAIAGKGMKVAYEAARPGVDELEVSAEIRYAMAKAGAEEIWDPLSVVAGPKSGYKHCSPSKRVMRDGDMIFVDISPIYKGYIVDVARTWVIGSGGSADAFKMLDTALLMSDEGIKAIKPGATAREVMSLCEELAKEAGVLDYYYPVGHGTGSTKFEKPVIAHDKLDVVFEPGMVFSFEPMLVKEDLGTGVVEDTILVTERGAEILPCFTRKLW